VRTVFTDNVQSLTSVEAGRGGVWLMCPPRLLFIPDRDGDDVPDSAPEVILDGFEVGEDSYHNLANGLKWGPDGWLYGRCGHSCPGLIGIPGTPPQQRIPIDGGIWRYHPERRTVEVLCHGTVNPWGHDWDQHGELFFINTVIGHLWHMIPGSHFRESFGESSNPFVYERMDTIADHFHFDTKSGWAKSRDGSANDLGGGHAHVGMMIYQARRWPQEYHHRLFTLNMHGRRANVERMERLGAGYVGRHEPDFLVSPDPFFRGMEISVGPDGNVWIPDWSDTGECHEQSGVHRTSGRIFRIRYGEPPAAAPTTSFLLPWCLNGPGRLPQLWKDYQQKKTTPDSLRELLHDPDENLRVWAIRLLTDFWPLDTIAGPSHTAEYPDDPQTYNELLRLASEDSSGLVHLTLASTLQRLPVRQRAALGAKLVRHPQFAEDRQLPMLVWYGLIPLGQQDPMALAEIAQQTSWPSTLKWMARLLASQSEKHPEALNRLLKSACDFELNRQQAVLTGMSDGFRGWRRAPQPSEWPAFSQSAAAERSPELVRELNLLFGDGYAAEQLHAIVLNSRHDMPTRQTALQTLIDADANDLRRTCEAVLNVRPLNTIAVNGLARIDHASIAAQIIRNYRRFDPPDRPHVINVLVSRPSFARTLLESIRDGQSVSAEDLNSQHARRIRNFNDPPLTALLASVWGELRETSADHQQRIDQFRQQLQPDQLQTADAGHGRVLFRKVCSQCHMLFGDGAKIGPDLTGAQRSSIDYLLQNIVDPNAVVGKDYRMTIVGLKDGRVLNGLVVSADDRILTLQTATDLQTIRLDDIEERRETSLSPMPDGLLDRLTPDERRSLIHYLMQPGQTPLPDSN
ncbi:MAG: c-type cytochrome, partial [Planctomycetaceae bacterium]|nr:c-type cytochrome [Planctomycetaceae bacterium]